MGLARILNWRRAPRGDREFRRKSRAHRSEKRSDKVFLMSAFAQPLVTYVSSLVGPAVAEVEGCRLGIFSFDRNLSGEFWKDYRSFGARVEMEGRDVRSEKFLGEAEKLVRGWEGKWDVLNQSWRGLVIGDLIYDSYLRQTLRPTVDLKDERLPAIVAETLAIHALCEKYLDRNEVVGIMPDHFVYNRAGLLARMAWSRGVPAISYYPRRPFCLFRLPPREADLTARGPQFFPFRFYGNYLNGMTPSALQAAERKGCEAIERRLQGLDGSWILGGNSAYGAESGILEGSPSEKDGRKRVVVFLHDFTDAGHSYGVGLFPDFLEWILHLLGKAEKTPYEWWVKPHPNNNPSGWKEKVRANGEVLEMLAGRFPKVKFLDPGVGNEELLREGMRCAFTVHGSIAHELAYVGIPVVNAGPNPHMAFDFCHNPKSVEEFDELIGRAGDLPERQARGEIGAFYFAHAFCAGERIGAKRDLLPEKFLRPGVHTARETIRARLDDFVTEEPPGHREYFRGYFQQRWMEEKATPCRWMNLGEEGESEPEQEKFEL